MEKAVEITESQKEGNWLYPKHDNEKMKEMVELVKKHNIPIHLIDRKTKQIIEPTSDLCLKIFAKLTSSGSYWSWLDKYIGEGKRETRETFHIASCPFCQMVYAKAKSGALFGIKFWSNEEPETEALTFEEREHRLQTKDKDLQKLLSEDFPDYT